MNNLNTACSIILYADGACRGNQYKDNVGAWAYHLSFNRGDVLVKTTQDNAAVNNTTNNKMELTAVIKGLQAIKDKHSYPIKVYTDSAYVVNGVNEWHKGCERKHWKDVKNPELWKELLALARECRDIVFCHVYGHSGVKTNDLVDRLCNDAMDNYKGDL